MKRDLVDFTRGSQLIGHFGFMFAAGLKAPVFVALTTFSLLVWWRTAALLDDHQAYLCWMRAYAWIYGWFEFDRSKQMALELRSGGHLLVPITTLADHPLVLLAWARFMVALKQAAGLAALFVVPATAAFAWFAARFGRRSKESRHERGATLATTAELAREIADHNQQQQAEEYRRLLGPGWRMTSRSERRRVALYEPYRLAGVPFPWRLEQSHAMLIGTTGTGKTVALRELLRQARERGDRAVIFDLTGAFIEAFFDPARDVILNPLDARCPQWSVFEDCRDEASLTAAAEALVPHDGGGSEHFWVLAARMLFVEMCLKLMAEGRATNAALSSELMTASLAHVHRLMEGTIADPLTAPEAARMAESIRAVFNANAKALRMLPSDGPLFSVRQWTLGECERGSFLFVSARYVDMAVASRLLTVWMDTAMTTLMTGPRSSDLKLWFLFDELGALHRLPAIEKGLQTVRNYGGAIVAGVHAYAKLKETYGDNMAMTLAALARTKLVLATADRESATWCSDFIGHRQYREMEEGYSYGYNNARDAVSLTPRRQIEPLLLPDQLMNLPRLQGYLKYPDGFPAAPIKLRFVAYPQVADGFVPRITTTPSKPRGNDGSSNDAQPTGASANDQGPGPSDRHSRDMKPSNSRQAELQFERQADAPTRVDPLVSRTPTQGAGSQLEGLAAERKPDLPAAEQPIGRATLRSPSRNASTGEGTSDITASSEKTTVTVPAAASRRGHDRLGQGEHKAVEERRLGIDSEPRREFDDPDFGA